MAYIQKCRLSEAQAGHAVALGLQPRGAPSRRRRRSTVFADYQYSSSESDSDSGMPRVWGAPESSRSTPRARHSPRPPRTPRTPRRVQLIGARMRLLPLATSNPRTPTTLHHHTAQAPRGGWSYAGGGGGGRVPLLPATPDHTVEEDWKEESESEAEGECAGSSCGGGGYCQPGANKQPPQESEWTWSDAESACSELAFDAEPGTFTDDASATACGDCVSRSLAPTSPTPTTCTTCTDDELTDDTLCGCSE